MWTEHRGGSRIFQMGEGRTPRTHHERGARSPVVRLGSRTARTHLLVLEALWFCSLMLSGPYLKHSDTKRDTKKKIDIFGWGGGGGGRAWCPTCIRHGSIVMGGPSSRLPVFVSVWRKREQVETSMLRFLLVAVLIDTSFGWTVRHLGQIPVPYAAFTSILPDPDPESTAKTVSISTFNPLPNTLDDIFAIRDVGNQLAQNGANGLTTEVLATNMLWPNEDWWRRLTVSDRMHRCVVPRIFSRGVF